MGASKAQHFEELSMIVVKPAESRRTSDLYCLVSALNMPMIPAGLGLKDVCSRGVATCGQGWAAPIQLKISQMKVLA